MTSGKPSEIQIDRVYPSEQSQDVDDGASVVVFAIGRGFAALVYALLYNFIYEVYLFPLFEYFGFRNYESNGLVIIFGVSTVVLAAMALPKRITLPSDFCSWMIFVLIYVPAVITISKSGTLPGNGAEVLIGSLFISQLLISTIPRMLTLREIYFPALRDIANPVGLSTVSVLISVILTARFYGVMDLAGFDEIYIQRENASVGESNFVFRYLVLWQTYAIAPLLIAVSFYTRRKIYLAPPILGLVVIYLITAAKATLFIYATIFFVYLLNRWGAFRRPSLLMSIAIVPLALAAVVFWLLGSRLEGPLMIGTSVIIMRGIAVQGMLANLYAEFFTTNPYTYFSHVNIVGLLIEYPYAEPLSTELSYFLIGNADAGANSSFWATDGIASAGSLGVVLIGLFVGVVFSAINAFMRDVDPAFAALLLTPFVMALANVSIFTTILSAGAFIVFLLGAPLFSRLREQSGGRVHPHGLSGQPGSLS